MFIVSPDFWWVLGVPLVAPKRLKMPDMIVKYSNTADSLKSGIKVVKNMEFQVKLTSGIDDFCCCDARYGETFFQPSNFKETTAHASKWRHTINTQKFWEVKVSKNLNFALSPRKFLPYRRRIQISWNVHFSHIF